MLAVRRAKWEHRLEHRLSPLFIAFLSGALVFSPIAFLLSRHAKNPPTNAKQSYGLDDKDIFLYLEAIAKIKEDASFLTSDITREQIIRESIKAYLSQKDASSDYLTRDEYRKFKETQDDSYVGIGMEVKKDRDGRIICVPYPGGPAAQAGISVGDELKTIGGNPVYGKSVFAVASMARGKPGTELNLLLATGNGIVKEIALKRSTVTTESVSTHWFDKSPIIRIFFFTRDTSDKLKRVLQAHETNRPIIIDLRGNAGGDLHAAIDSATLFLPKGKRILSIKTRRQPKTYESKAGPLNLNSPVYLWQDEATASAAEVFIAALTENDRAVSIGKTTFGKGTEQEIIELSDGSALVLTMGLLRTPKGTEYDGLGLVPTYPLKDVGPQTRDYLKKVEELSRLSSERVK
jgi:carboxyl-terminal processing protease